MGIMKDAVVPAHIDPELESQASAMSGKHLWAMKRKAQARDHELAARGEVPAAAVLLLRPERLLGALVEWPEAPLIDD